MVTITWAIPKLKYNIILFRQLGPWYLEMLFHTRKTLWIRDASGPQLTTRWITPPKFLVMHQGDLLTPILQHRKRSPPICISGQYLMVSGHADYEHYMKRLNHGPIREWAHIQNFRGNRKGREDWCGWGNIWRRERLVASL